MTIKAILRNGHIEPIEPLRADWVDGKELMVEEPVSAESPEEIEQWVKEVEESSAKIPPEDHALMEQALEEIERESKEAVRREWGMK